LRTNPAFPAPANDDMDEDNREQDESENLIEDEKVQNNDNVDEVEIKKRSILSPMLGKKKKDKKVMDEKPINSKFHGAHILDEEPPQ
jgi:hypothetical protein